MAKVELVRGMAYIDGWPEVRDRLEEKMKKWRWPKLEEWTVRIRISNKTDAAKFKQGDKNAHMTVDKENKILMLAYQPECACQPKAEASLIMCEFVSLERENQL